MFVHPRFADWALACTRLLLSRPALASYFLEEATLVLGTEDELPTSATSDARERSLELLQAVAVHAGREHVAHEIVEVLPSDDALEPFADGEVVGVPLPTAMLDDRWATIAMLARGVVTPVVLELADRAPYGSAARGAVLDVAAVLAGFGAPVLRFCEQLGVAPREWPSDESEPATFRDLDGVEVAFVHAVFEILHDHDRRESDRALTSVTRMWLDDARELAERHRDEIVRIREKARAGLATYRER